MCYFITVAVHRAHEGTLRDRLQADYAISRSNNPYLLDLLPDDFRAYEVINGACSCELYCRPLDPQGTAHKIRTKYRKRKFRKRGWTDDRIEREVAATIASVTRQRSGLSRSLRNALCDIVEATNRLFLLVHWYGSDVDTEPLRPLAEKGIGCDELNADDLAVGEDTIITIERGR